MNEKLIEDLLRKSPAPQAPADLCQRLVADIRLPRAESRRGDAPAARSLVRRWFPALTFGGLMLAGFVVIAVQINLISALKRENESLRSQAPNLDSLRQANVQVQRLQSDNANLAHLQNDNAELQRLRAGEVELQTQAGDLAQLRADHQKLVAARPVSGAPADFFAESKEKAERISCVNNLKQVGLVFRIWAGDNHGHFPPDLISMTNELSTWRLLRCPGDDANTVSNWADVAAGKSSYIFYTAGLMDTNAPNTIVAECPIHHNILMLDGSVQMLSVEAYDKTIKVVNGRKVWQP